MTTERSSNSPDSSHDSSSNNSKYHVIKPTVSSSSSSTSAQDNVPGGPNKPKSRIYVSRIPDNATQEDIRNYFEQYGRVESIANYGFFCFVVRETLGCFDCLF